MGWRKRTKFIFDAFHSSRIIPTKNPIQESVFVKLKMQQYTSSNKLVSPCIRSGYSLNNGFLNQNKVNPFAQNGLKRFYSVDKNNVDKNNVKNTARTFSLWETIKGLVDVGLGIVMSSSSWKWEIVPFTNRKHFVMLSKSREQQLREILLNIVKFVCGGKILPEIHPHSVRVRLIGKKIVDSLEKELNKEQVWSDHGYASVENIESYVPDGDDSLKGSSNEHVEGKWSKADEILDDKRVQQSRKKDHLDGLKWEFLVVDADIINAFCIPGGTIVVFTGLLKHCKSDAEIATIIGHEAAHIVARHSAERVTANFMAPGKLTTARREIEADYIGLLLMASAGYDPRVAPSFYEKIDKIDGRDPNSTLEDNLCTHPSGKKRAQMLGQTKVMEEALLIYREFLSNPSKRRNEISRKRRRKSFTKK